MLFSQTASWFQLARFWSSHLQVLDSKGPISRTQTRIEPTGAVAWRRPIAPSSPPSAPALA